MIFAVILSVFPVTAVSAEPDAFSHVEIPDGQETVTVGDDVYTVLRTAEQLKAFFAAAPESQAEAPEEPTKAILACDISLGEVTEGELNIKAGTVLNGNGNTLTYTGAPAFGLNSGSVTVRNLNIGTEAAPVPGVAGNVAASVTWENVNVYSIGCTDTYSSSSDNQTYTCTGGWYAFEKNVTSVFRNCSLNAKIENATGAIAGLWIGGHNGYGSSAYEFTGCRASGSIAHSPAEKTNDQSFTGIYVGLLTGDSVIENCTSDATVTSSAGFAGWIGGYMNGKSNSIRYCVNRGDMSGAAYIGAFLGGTNLDWTFLSSGTVTIESCINFGDLGTNTEDSHVGGIFGRSAFVYDKQSTVSISGCLNGGNITSRWGRVGGLIALISGTKYELKNNAVVGTVANAGADSGLLIGCCDVVPMTGNYAFGKQASTAGNRGILVFSWNSAADLNAVASGNKYIGSESYSNYHAGGLDEASAVTANEALKLIQARFPDVSFSQSGGSIFTVESKYMLNDSGDAFVSASPRMVGMQNSLTANADGTVNVRLVASLQGYTRYGTVGFEVRINGNLSIRNCTEVYTSILATGTNGVEVIRAEDMGAAVFYTAVLENLRPEDAGKITVTVFGMLDEFSGNVTPDDYLYGETITLTVSDGEWVPVVGDLS